jgi:4-coumarate--CoA ligase
MIFESPDPVPTLPPAGTIVYDHVLPLKTAFDPDSPAFIDGITGRVITRADLRRDTLRLARGIDGLKDSRKDAGKEPVVMIFSPNSMDYPGIFLGAQAAGCITSLVNASYLMDELAHQIRDSTPFAIFIHPTLVDILESAIKLLKTEGYDTQAIKVYSTSSEPISSDKADRQYPSYQSLYRDVSSDIAPGYRGTRMTKEEIDDTPAVLCYSSGTVSLGSCGSRHMTTPRVRP